MICYNTDIPILVENTTCGHRVCKDCAIVLERGVLENGNKMEVVAPPQEVCLVNAGICAICSEPGKYRNVVTGQDLLPETLSPLGWVDKYTNVPTASESIVYKLEWRKNITDQREWNILVDFFGKR